MKIVAVFCNVVLFGFICLVLVVDGPPKGASYLVFTLWSLMTLILSAAVVFRMAANDGWLGPQRKKETREGPRQPTGQSSTGIILRVAAIVSNVVLLAFTCWAFVDQYPHPEEDGLIAFTVLVVLTPILSLVVLFRGGPDDGWLGLHMKKKALEELGPKPL